MDIRICFLCNSTFNAKEKKECCGISILHPISILRNVIVNVTVQMETEEIVTSKSKVFVRTPKRGRKKRTKEAKLKKEKNKRKDKKIDQWIKDKVAIRDGGKCVICKSKEGLHLHHVIHREHGGTDDPDNLKTLCELCHAEAHRGEPVYNIMIQRLFQYQAI